MRPIPPVRRRRRSDYPRSGAFFLPAQSQSPSAERIAAAPGVADTSRLVGAVAELCFWAMPHLPLEAAPALGSSQLYYEVAGSGPALVFAHGLGGNHISWWQQVPAFCDRFTCVTFAHRGFHPSTGDADPAAYAGDLLALLDHLKIDRASLVAQSMGGWTCVDFALRHPERVERLLLADTTGTVRFPEEDSAPAAAGTAAEELARRGIHPACGARMAAEQPALHNLYRELDALSASLDKTAVRAELGRLRTVAPDLLAATGIRLMWVWGAEDVVLSPALAELARTHFPRARVEVVPEAGHSVYFERAAEFNRLLGEFLLG